MNFLSSMILLAICVVLMIVIGDWFILGIAFPELQNKRHTNTYICYRKGNLSSVKGELCAGNRVIVF